MSHILKKSLAKMLPIPLTYNWLLSTNWVKLLLLEISGIGNNLIIKKELNYLSNTWNKSG